MLHKAGDGNGGDTLLLCSSKHAQGSLARCSLEIHLPLTGNHKVGAFYDMVKADAVQDNVHPRFELGVKECKESPSQASGGTCSRNSRNVFLQIPEDNLGKVFEPFVKPLHRLRIGEQIAERLNEKEVA